MKTVSNPALSSSFSAESLFAAELWADLVEQMREAEYRIIDVLVPLYSAVVVPLGLPRKKRKEVLGLLHECWVYGPELKGLKWNFRLK